MDERIRRTMKSYNNLYEKLLSEENIRLAISNAAKGKNKKNKRHLRLKRIANNSDEYMRLVPIWIKTYKAHKHRSITINDGVYAKKRQIVVPTAVEEVIHHAVVNILKEITLPSMYEHSYASIPGRGTHKAVKTIRKWLNNDHENTKYCLKLDIRKYFDSVSQGVLLDKFRKIIRDYKFYLLLEEIVSAVGCGIPLGFVTSQWFANFLLTDLDHKIKEEWGAKYYIRFMDDMVIFGNDKKHLHELFDKIQDYLFRNLYLEVKDNWQVFYMNDRFGKGRALDFLGYKFYRFHTGLRKKIAIRMHRKAKRIYVKEHPNIHDARQMVTYAGYTKNVNVYCWFHKRIKPYVSIRYLRKRISAYDRNNAGGLANVV